MLGVMTAALVILAPLFAKGNYQKLFCEAFSDINGFPKHQQFCGILEKMHVCSLAHQINSPDPASPGALICVPYSRPVPIPDIPH